MASTFYNPGIANPETCPKAFRKSARITITICYSTYAALEQKSSEQGRSISNLAAYLLENGLQQTSI
jgi:hypothetical protein